MNVRWRDLRAVAKMQRQLERAHLEAAHVRSLATALVKTVSSEQMAEVIVQECKVALGADIICLYYLQGDDVFEMVAEAGCTEEMKQRWRFMSRDVLPLLKLDNPHGAVFYGSAEEFKTALPRTHHLIDRSGQEMVGYVPLVVNCKAIGILGFSFNHKPSRPPEIPYTLTLANLCAQALERARWFEREQLARREAENASLAKSDFLANISHEIRTPVGVVHGFAELLTESEGLTESQRHWASVVRRNARQLMDLIGDVLDLSKIEAKKLEIKHKLFSLPDLIEEIRSGAHIKSAEKKVAFKLNVQNIPTRVWSDPVRIRQIFLNLIGNAIKFTSRGHVSVNVEFHHGRLLAYVEDTGVGISSEDQLRIFEPFFQSSAFADQCVGGTGLGLPISMLLAQALGGSLSLLQSTAGVGSTFRFEIPCEVPDGLEVAEIGRTASDLNLNGLNVLLVEDSLDNQELVSLILNQVGARVDVASTGQLGVNMALRSNYDVILMDIQMPGMDGYGALSQLRARGYIGPIAALTALAMKEEKERSFERGFNEYLTKPIDRRALVETVWRLGRVAQQPTG